MHYISRTQDRLNSIEWHKLYTDPAYAVVLRTVVHGARITTTWVGVVFEHEKRPKTYCVDVVRVENSAPVLGELVDAQWHDSEESALTAHGELENKVEELHREREAKRPKAQD